MPPKDCIKFRSRRQLLLQTIFRLAYCRWTLFDNDGQVKCPLALFATFPWPAVFQSYCAGALLECFECPFLFPRRSYKPLVFRRHELVSCFLSYCLVADLRSLGPLKAGGGGG